jgi:hypothetical protein
MSEQSHLAVHPKPRMACPECWLSPKDLAKLVETPANLQAAGYPSPFFGERPADDGTTTP